MHNKQRIYDPRESPQDMDFKFPIKTDAEFNQLMEEIDADMQARNLQIVGRDLECMRQLCIRLKIEILFNVTHKHAASPNHYTFFNIGSHVELWQQRRYGDRLKFDPNVGYFATLILKDAWLVQVPLVAGRAMLVVERDLSISFPNSAFGPWPEHALKINLLKLVKNLTQDIASRMSFEETSSLQEQFLLFFKCHRLAMEIRDASLPMARLALFDLSNGAKKVVLDRREYGSAKWDALQGAEKFLKHYLQFKGTNFPRTHDLLRLVEMAERSGLARVSPHLVDDVQCSAEVRYNADRHSVADVVLALTSAARIGLSVLEAAYPAVAASL